MSHITKINIKCKNKLRSKNQNENQKHQKKTIKIRINMLCWRKTVSWYHKITNLFRGDNEICFISHGQLIVKVKIKTNKKWTQRPLPAKTPGRQTNTWTINCKSIVILVCILNICDIESNNSYDPLHIQLIFMFI